MDGGVVVMELDVEVVEGLPRRRVKVKVMHQKLMCKVY